MSTSTRSGSGVAGLAVVLIVGVLVLAAVSRTDWFGNQVDDDGNIIDPQPTTQPEHNRRHDDNRNDEKKDESRKIIVQVDWHDMDVIAGETPLAEVYVYVDRQQVFSADVHKTHTTKRGGENIWTHELTVQRGQEVEVRITYTTGLEFIHCLIRQDGTPNQVANFGRGECGCSLGVV